MGVLVDLSACVGCRLCEYACKSANGIPAGELAEYDDPAVFREPRRPAPDAFTVVNRFDVRPAGAAERRPLYAKINCMHCNHAACVSACLVGALSKEENGAVTYDAWKCIGCRYCMVACPFQLPAYSYEEVLTPQVRKCQLCFADRTGKGDQHLPACVEACPRQVMKWGKRKDLLTLAHARIAAQPGRYVDHVYGEHEVGGTSWLYLSPVPFEQAGFLTLGHDAPPALTEKIQHGVFKYWIAPIGWYSFLLSMFFVTKRRAERAHAAQHRRVALPVLNGENGAAIGEEIPQSPLLAESATRARSRQLAGATVADEPASPDTGWEETEDWHDEVPAPPSSRLTGPLESGANGVPADEEDDADRSGDDRRPSANRAEMPVKHWRAVDQTRDLSGHRSTHAHAPGHEPSHAHDDLAAPIPHKLLTPGVWALIAIVLTGVGFGLYRFIFGLAASTNLDQQHPWGLWIAMDVGSGIALAGGGFVSAAIFHVFHRERYHLLARSALLTALLGYTFYVPGLLADIGRWYNIWHPTIPTMWQGNSVLFEVGLCVMIYLNVQYAELTPIVCRRLLGDDWTHRWPRTRKLIQLTHDTFERIMPLLLCLGVALSTFHQSSLGNLMVIAPYKLHHLWWSPLSPLLFLFSAMMVGLPMVIFTILFASWCLKREPEMAALTPLARKYVPVFVAMYLVTKVGDMVWRGTYGYLDDNSLLGNLFLIEVLAGVVLPLAMFLTPRVCRSPRLLATACLLVICGVVLNRLNVFVIGYFPPYETHRYFPSVTEFAVSAGLVAALLLAYRVAVTYLPILEPRPKAAAVAGAA